MLRGPLHFSVPWHINNTRNNNSCHFNTRCLRSQENGLISLSKTSPPEKGTTMPHKLPIKKIGLIQILGVSD